MAITQAVRGPVGSFRPRGERQPRGWAPAGRSALDLLQLVQDYTEECADALPVAGDDLSERSYELLELNDELEIWAIHWPKDQGLELHDHGGSSGALWVVAGALLEHVVATGGGLSQRRIEVGGGSAFGPSWIHDVVNTSDVPATSVHVYSPPMPSMTFYRQEASGLKVERAEYRADPAWAP